VKQNNQPNTPRRRLLAGKELHATTIGIIYEAAIAAPPTKSTPATGVATSTTNQ
jgi:hypothetical protein